MAVTDIAFVKGGQARRGGKHLSANPYKQRSLRDAWMAGWCDEDQIIATAAS